MGPPPPGGDMPIKSLYLIGSLRNIYLGNVAATLRETGIEVFDDWFAAGPEADDAWQRYEMKRGRDYATALDCHAATHVFEFDHYHLKRCEAAVLALPAGKSGHLEFGWMLGQGKPGWVLLDKPDRWDVMYKFATGVYASVDQLRDTIAIAAGKHRVKAIDLAPRQVGPDDDPLLIKRDLLDEMRRR